LTAALDWNAIDLVVFDVDGTLYDQKRMRLVMLRRLLAATLRERSLRTLGVLRTFRQVRESLGDEEAAGFMQLQYSRTAERHGCTAQEVEALTHEWMEQRPLDRIGGCRYPHLDTLFDALHAAGKRVAVLSDYPAVDKLRALGLQADPVVCATDAEIARLKPDPHGLQTVLRRTGVPAGRALMIGDRFDRDGAVARRCGVRALIRSREPHPDFETFRRYDDPVFQPLLSPAMAVA